MADKELMDEDDDVQMNPTNNADTNTTNAGNDDKKDNLNTNDSNNNNNNNKNVEEKTENKINIGDEKEEKKEATNNNDLNKNHGLNPLLLVQSAMSDFMNEMSAADIKASSLYTDHFERQQKLMKQFVADSLRLMHEFNTKIDPIHDILKKLKSPLQDVLLNQFMTIPCESLDNITKKTRKNIYTKSWGVTPLTYQYNKKNAISNNPQLQYIDLGAEIQSLKPQIKQTQNVNNNNNNNDNNNNTQTKPVIDDDKNKKDDDDDSTMNDNNEPHKIDEKDLYTQAILGYLSNLDNITSSQTDLVLGFFTKARAEQKRIEIKKQEQLKEMQQKQQQAEQRTAGASMLISVLPWMTMEQAGVVMEMKQDIIEQATNYCMNTDPADLYLAINEWKKSHPPASNNNNNNMDDMGDFTMINQYSNLAKFAGPHRSSIDKRVLNRSQSTGDTKHVTFRCTDIGDDGQITLQAVLDRNHIPLDPQSAKLLHLSVSDLMDCGGITIIASDIVELFMNNNVLQIVFQVIKEKPPQLDITNMLQNITIPEHIMQTNDFQIMQEYAQQFMQQQQMKPQFNRNRGIGGGGDKTEFIPIQFKPKCRDLEYKLDFEDKDIPSNACLKKVSHHMDGPVLFRGIYDSGSGLIASGLNQPIEIFSEIIDDVTHNIVCIIFDNELRQDVVIDVKNLSFTEVTLKSVITDSEKDFTKKDAAGNNISYRIIVKDKKVVGVLTKFGNEIKEMPFIEHPLPKVGDLVTIPARNMLGIIKCIPTGLIVTNDPNKNIEAINIGYKKNVNSIISRKHCADLDGYVDIDIVREGTSSWRLIDDALKQSFAVPDIKPASDSDINLFIQYKQQNQGKLMDEITILMKNVENDFDTIKNKKNDAKNRQPKDILSECTNTVKTIQELTSNLKNRKKQLSDDEKKFIELVNQNVNKYNREIRALRFEVKMM